MRAVRNLARFTDDRSFVNCDIRNLARFTDAVNIEKSIDTFIQRFSAVVMISLVYICTSSNYIICITENYYYLLRLASVQFFCFLTACQTITDIRHA